MPGPVKDYNYYERILERETALPRGAGLFSRMGPVVGSNLAGMSRAFSERTGAMHVQGMHWVKQGLGLSSRGTTGLKKMGFFRMAGRMATDPKFRAGKGRWGRFAMKGLGPAFMAYGAISGYQEGGVMGAAKEVGTFAAFDYGFGAAGQGLKGALGLGGKAARSNLVSIMGKSAGLEGYGAETLAKQIWRSRTYSMGSLGFAASVAGWTMALWEGVKGARKAMDVGGRTLKAARRLELGTPVVDEFGTAATMRQRSLQAIQRSSLNGRYALGNEATLMSS